MTLRIPGDSLERARLAAFVFGTPALLSQLAQIGNAQRSPEYHRLATAAILAAFAVLLTTHLRRRSSWWTVPLVPALIAIGAGGLSDPLAGTALALSSTVVLSLYGSAPEWTLRVLGAAVAIPAGVAITPYSAGREISWHSPTVLNLVPQLLLMAVLTRGIHLSLRRQQRAAARESLLARAGLAMLGVTDVDRIRELGRQTAAALIALDPGVALLILRRGADGLRVANLAGVPEELRGRRLGDGVPDAARLAELLPGYRWWHVDSLGADPQSAGLYLVVAGRRPVPGEVLDALRTLSHQVVLAESGCLAHAELEHSALHDHLTRIPNRAKLLRAAADALAGAAPGTVALLNIDLDDFKQVNDAYGHAAGDELLVLVADRLTEVAGGRGLAGRFGGDEFAVLLTGVAGPDDAAAVAERLCARLSAPVPLAAGTATVGASIGVAVAEAGITVAELVRRADVAMYAAKTLGKNRTRLYAPDRQLTG